MKKMITLSGAQASGKTTVGNMLSEMGFEVIALADVLKREVSAAWAIPVERMFDRNRKDIADDRCAIMFSRSPKFMHWFITSEQFYSEKAMLNYPLLSPRTPRELLVAWSQWRKSVDGDDVFIVAAMRKILDEGFHHNIAITDARLPLEQAKLRLFAEDWHYSFQSWEIARPGYDYSNRDKYDTRLPDDLIDRVIINDIDFNHLKSELCLALHDHTIETVK